MKFDNLSLAAKLNLVLTSVMLLMSVALSFALSAYLTRTLEARSMNELKQTNLLVVDMIDAYHSSLEKAAERLGKLFASLFHDNFSLDEARTVQIGELRTPTLRSGGVSLNLQFAEVDHFSAITGGVATIFARQGDDFVRIATSLRKENGERATGTLLGLTHPAYAQLMAGQSFVGKAHLFGKDYMTQYAPIKTSAGKVIGILFIGVDFTQGLKGLKERIRSIRLGTSGYVFVIDAGSSKGTLVAHPVLEGKNLLDAQDADGRAFIREMLDTKDGLIRYPWMNTSLGDSAQRDKVAAFNHYQAWDWVVVSGGYLDEFTAESRRMRNILIAALLGFVVVLVAVIQVALRFWLSKPLEVAVCDIERLAGGDLGQPEHGRHTGQDEIGRLLTAMDSMRISLANMIQTIRANAELEVVNQRLRDLDQLKSDFLSSVSHEIRTPMNAIIGMSHLALQTPLDKKQRNYIEKVHRSGENLLGIINDILDFSKIEAGKLTLETIAFSLDEVMDNLANLIGMKAEDRGLELLFNAAPDVPTALIGDPLRLGQILINLGNNAVKFTERGEVVVGVEKVKEDADGVELHFWVKDTGIGMTAEQSSKVFQSFSQADASTTRKYGGSGLGLAISKNLVERMRGRIWVDSEAGKGSVFHFHAAFGVQTEPLPQRMLRADELLGVRALVVDDNASARDILATMARNIGLQVDVACNGKEALAMLVEAEQQERAYDLVLMDWKMPVMDGVEAVRQMQNGLLQREPAVIMVSAYDREGALSDAGIRLKSVLLKPVNASTMLEAIGEALAKNLAAKQCAHEQTDHLGELMRGLAGARVLLVEDNAMNQELALELLGQAGMEIVVANNGQEAIDILARDPRFDGVLMDCQMPVMDGYTATREIRSIARFKDLPILAMTANAMAGDKKKAIAAGMHDHIAKPLNIGEMFATIGKWIKPSGLAGGVARTEVTPTRADLSASLPPLPGIDVRSGLATTMNNERLYLSLLLKFRDTQGRFAELFRAARADSDAAAPERLAHTLKATAGNIGARAVQNAAAELERVCREGEAPPRIDEFLARTLDELAPVVAGLVAIEVTNPVAPTVQAADAATVAALTERLDRLLTEGSVKAAPFFEEHGALFKTAFARHYRAIDDAIEAFDFEAALAALKDAVAPSA